MAAGKYVHDSIELFLSPGCDAWRHFAWKADAVQYYEPHDHTACDHNDKSRNKPRNPAFFGTIQLT